LSYPPLKKFFGSSKNLNCKQKCVSAPKFLNLNYGCAGATGTGGGTTTGAAFCGQLLKIFTGKKKSLLNFIIGFKIAAEECLHPSAAPKPRALGHNHINKLPDQVPNLFILSQKCLPLAGMTQRRRRS
jgi:hypothetical protein